MSETADNLTKVCIDLPNHGWLEVESFWVKPMGGDLYELQNAPFCAYGLNFGDTVRAVSALPDLKPEITEVVERSGNQTLRVSFAIEREQQAPCIEHLQAMGVLHFETCEERVPGSFVDRPDESDV